MRLLITGAWQQARDYLPALEGMGHETAFMQREEGPLPCDPAWVEGVICNGLFLHHPIGGFPNLRYIQLTSAGFDRVPLDEIKRRGIQIHNARGVYSIPMAEFAVAGVLYLYKRLDDFRSAQRAYRWEKLRDLQELAGQTVMIVGCGSVGTECAKRFRAFGCRIVGVDIAPRADGAYDEMLPISALDSALPQADVVILTVPLTPDTRGLIDGRRLGLIRGVLVNISRGGVIDQAALEQWPGPAVLDVFEEEPLPPDSPLWQKENAVITPHNSFVGEWNGKRLAEVILDTLGAYGNESVLCASVVRLLPPAHAHPAGEGPAAGLCLRREKEAVSQERKLINQSFFSHQNRRREKKKRGIGRRRNENRGFL